MYRIQDKDFAHYIGVQIKLNQSTVQYRDWLANNIGREYQDWALKMVNVNYDGFTLLVFLHHAEDVALFKLAMM
jgi:hypothetical protein